MTERCENCAHYNEITPEMIKAGAHFLWDLYISFDGWPPEYLAEMVLKAAFSARRENRE